MRTVLAFILSLWDLILIIYQMLLILDCLVRIRKIDRPDNTLKEKMGRKMKDMISRNHKILTNLEHLCQQNRELHSIQKDKMPILTNQVRFRELRSSNFKTHKKIYRKVGNSNCHSEWDKSIIWLPHFRLTKNKQNLGLHKSRPHPLKKY